MIQPEPVEAYRDAAFVPLTRAVRSLRGATDRETREASQREIEAFVRTRLVHENAGNPFLVDGLLEPVHFMRGGGLLRNLRRDPRRVVRAVVGVAMWVGAYFAALLLVGRFTGINGPNVYVLVLLLPLLAIPLAVMADRKQRGWLQRGVCPICGYSFEGLPSEIEADELDGLELGPARCPECGTLWPAIP